VLQMAKALKSTLIFYILLMSVASGGISRNRVKYIETILVALASDYNLLLIELLFYINQLHFKC
jgi:hypothetical protein